IDKSSIALAMGSGSILDMDVRLFWEFQLMYSSCRRLEKFAVCLRGDLMVVAHIAPLKGLLE
ncbi:hypothetical protein, partial [Providencia stuartii]|uniref:hypothetical protein n=1 Tax=Providencia stuartii TaxID=588 RepID=UPI00195444E7